MHQALETLVFRTGGTGLHEITGEVADWLRGTGIVSGVLTLFCQHTSAGLLITENASPTVPRDLLRWLARTAPEGPGYEHDDEGPDDMPSHLRSALTATQLSIPVQGGKAVLGTWQGIFLFEHRRHPREREIALHLIGE